RGTATMAFRGGFAATVSGTRLDAEAEDRLSDIPDYEVTEIAAGLSWFHPSGFFARGRTGVVHHGFVNGEERGTDNFPILDLTLGYRLPNGRGVATFEMRNATGTEFGFEDRPALPEGSFAEPRYARSFTAMGRLTLGF
ncbi:MAG: hypothetical protein AAFR52_13465, partial [Pseudomonadota bacterium]